MASLHPLLQPYKPTPDDPFDAVKAAHLLNRAGFGGTPEEIEKVRKLGPHDAADWLLDFPDRSAEEQDKADVPDLDAIGDYPKSFMELRRQFMGKSPEERKMLQQKFMRANVEALMHTWSWWVGRMAHGPHPLQEKLTLFWHGHFATSAEKVDKPRMMLDQNALLRAHAKGKFEELVRGIARDPAMLVYLDSTTNRRIHPINSRICVPEGLTHHHVRVAKPLVHEMAPPPPHRRSSIGQ